MSKVLVERDLLERALRSIQHNVGFTDTINDLTATLARPAHDVEASVPTFPCESCGVFHSYSEVAEAGGYCPQCEADYDERQMLADLLERYTALTAAPKPFAQDLWKQAVNNVSGYANLYSNGIGIVLEIKAEHARLLAAAPEVK